MQPSEAKPQEVLDTALQCYFWCSLYFRYVPINTSLGPKRRQWHTEKIANAPRIQSSGRVSNRFFWDEKQCYGCPSVTVDSKLLLLTFLCHYSFSLAIISGIWRCINLWLVKTNMQKTCSMGSMSCLSATLHTPWRARQRFATFTHFSVSPQKRPDPCSRTDRRKVSDARFSYWWNAKLCGTDTQSWNL